jgi:hypothetical protein
MCSTHLRDILGLNVLDGEHKERTVMKIVVIGGTGLIGSKLAGCGKSGIGDEFSVAV